MDIMIICLLVNVLITESQSIEQPFFLYAAFRQGTIGTMSLNGALKDYCQPIGTLGVPRDIAYDNDTNIVYVADLDTGIYKFPLDGKSPLELLVNIASAKVITITLDGEGHIFLASSPYIYRVNINGTGLIPWIYDVYRSYGIIVDTVNRYLIWSDVGNNTIERAPLDYPSPREIIISSTAEPSGLYLDTITKRMFWCVQEDSGSMLLSAKTDGTDKQIIAEIKQRYLYMHLTSAFDQHFYITGFRHVWSKVYTYFVYDFYAGVYTEMFASRTLRPWNLAIINAIIPENVCELHCNNGGSPIHNNGTCDCVYPWTGRVCNVCNKTCQNGGTVDADMCICDCLPQWSGDQCEECILTCQNGGTFNNNTCTCECKLQFGGRQCETFHPNDSDLKRTKIISAWPRYGPAAGGTWITVTGIHLPVGYNVSISIGELSCYTKLQNSTVVIGITKGLHGDKTYMMERAFSICLKSYNSTVVNSTYVFTYKENPVIKRVYPRESIIKGGTLLTVDGENLDSLAVIWMEVIMVLKILKSEDPLVFDEMRKTYATKCEIANKTRMYCPTPELEIPSRFLSQNVQSTTTKRDIPFRAKLPKVTKSLSSKASPRLKRGTVKLEFSNDGDVLEFYIGFRLDGIQDYENYSTIDVFTEPTFNTESTMRIFEQGKRLHFTGNGLDSGVTVSDYTITIGKEDCIDLELLSNSLSCYPPQRKPDVDDDNTDDSQIMIHIGLNLQHFAGYLRYLETHSKNTDTKLPLHIIIPATVVPAIVIIIVIAAVCETQRRLSCGKRRE